MLSVLSAYLFTPQVVRAQEDTTPPSVSDIQWMSSRYGSDDVYVSGEVLYVSITFSERVKVTGKPRLKIQLDDGKYDYSYLEYEFGNWFFLYRIPEGVTAIGGPYTEANAIELNGGSIKDYAGNNANLHHGGLAANNEFAVDGIRPTVKSIEITSDAGQDDTYEVGDVIVVSVTFSEDVNVPAVSGVVHGENYNWMPVLKLIVGEKERIAEFAGVDKAVVKFTYEVSSGDYAPLGIAIPQNAVSRNIQTPINFGGAIIVDDVGDSTAGGTNLANLRSDTLAANVEHKVSAAGEIPCAHEVINDATVSGTWATGCNS